MRRVLNWEMDKVEVRAVIKYFCRISMSLKEIHDNFIKTPGDESFLQHGEQMGC